MPSVHFGCVSKVSQTKVNERIIMSMPDFPVKFENPTYGLIGILLGAAVVALLILSFRKLRAAQKRLELVEWRKLRRIVRALNVGTKVGVVLSLSFLLARPYFPATIEVSVDFATEEQLAQYKVATVFLMDVSYSMNYSDLMPSRFEAAKAMSKLLLDKMNSNDLVGLISFNGSVQDTVLPTVNRTMITEKINDQILGPSTAIGTALDAAIGVLNDAYPEGARAIVLFSDGKSNMGSDPALAVDSAVSWKIPVFTVSLGTYGVGESAPTVLRDMASRTGGKFYEVRNEDMEDLATSISQISHDVKVDTLKTVYDKLTLPTKDYQAATALFSALLVLSLFLMWFTGV